MRHTSQKQNHSRYILTIMNTTLTRRFALAALLVMLGLSGVVAMLRSSAPQQQAIAMRTAEPHAHATSEDHKRCAANVLGKGLPSLPIRAADGTVINLVQRSATQPVLVVRYLGYSCSHCIEQLIELQKHSTELKAQGLHIVAFSEDTAEENAAVQKKYGFDREVFTFASDPANLAATALGGVYKEQDGSETELHISLVVKGGVVRFAHFDTKPMMDIPALLTALRAAQTAQ